MWRRILYTAVFVFLIASLFGQNDTDETDDLTKSFLNKKNQHSLSLEAAALSYSYVRQFSPKLNLGVRFQAGLGFQFLSLPNAFFNDFLIDIIKVQLIYRLPVSDHFYFNIGPYGAVSFSSEGGGYNYGLQASVFYTVKRIHLGLRIESGMYTDVDEGHPNTFGIFITPFVIGINF